MILGVFKQLSAKTFALMIGLNKKLIQMRWVADRGQPNKPILHFCKDMVVIAAKSDSRGLRAHTGEK